MQQTWQNCRKVRRAEIQVQTPEFMRRSTEPAEEAQCCPKQPANHPVCPKMLAKNAKALLMLNSLKENSEKGKSKSLVAARPTLLRALYWMMIHHVFVCSSVVHALIQNDETNAVAVNKCHHHKQRRARPIIKATVTMMTRRGDCVTLYLCYRFIRRMGSTKRLTLNCQQNCYITASTHHQHTLNEFTAVYSQTFIDYENIDS